MELIYKVLHLNEWMRFCVAKTFRGSELDQRDGFIHLSAGHQVTGTLEKYFPQNEPLILVALNIANSVKWESSRNNDKFPHLYRDLKISDVQWAVVLEK
jgi:uncharacterized protein (DUF952 family)